MSLIVTSEDLKSLIKSLPEVSSWSDLVSVFDRAGGAPHPDWQIPIIACQAAGGNSADAIPAAAAVACLQISIMLADDMLDDDPRGLHKSSGAGTAANLALAFQSVAYRLIEKTHITSDQKLAAVSSLSHAALATAYGQHLDDSSLPGEENYWSVVSAKSTPFYGNCYALGAIMAGADQAVTRGLNDFGILIGEIIQIQDDLEDAFSRPANPDWLRQGNNILIIYALNAEYEQKSEFVSLLANIAAGDENALVLAQEILISCGAVSYAAYHLVQRYQRTWSLLDELSLPDPEPITQILSDFGNSLSQLLSLSGVEVDLTTLRTGDVSSAAVKGEPK